MAHGKMANATNSLHQLKPKLTAFGLPSIVRVMFTSLCFTVFFSAAVQARDETRVSFSQGVQLNNNDRHAHPSTWWLTPRYSAHAHAEPYPFHRSRYSQWGARHYPHSSLSISWGSRPYYHNNGFYQQPRWRHWHGFEDNLENNYAFSPWHNNSRAYSTNDYSIHVHPDSAEARTQDAWRKQEYMQANQIVQDSGIQAAPISRLSTQVSHSSGLTSLPANASVVQKDNGIVYEWQGVSYRFDWNTQTYQVITDKADE
jgi:hypothetical protein